MNLYRNESSDPRYNAQRNLSGRTFYADDDTLRFHKARILETHIAYNGLIFALVESMALDMHNTRRGFRAVVFDVFGNVLSRSTLDDALSSKKAALKQMWTEINAIDAVGVTLGAIKRQEHQHAQEMEAMRAQLREMTKKAA